jgi:hypothetical protein
MKKLYAFIAIATLPLSGFTQQAVNCQTTPYGVTTCSNGMVGNQNSSGQTNWSGGNLGSNNVIASPNGNGGTYYSNGTSSTTWGNQTTYSNGQTCVNNGGQISCR